MKAKNIVLGASLMMLASVAGRSADVDPALKSAAQHVAVTVCATCHGPLGRSSTPMFRVRAGQHAGYLVAQMKAFKAQTRGDPDALGYMWGMAAPLDDEMIGALADYYSTQAPARGRTANTADIARGADIFTNGVAAAGIPPCVSCHGANAAGTDDFPRLAGQHAQYLLKQLHSFQSNLRNVAVMHGVASELKTPEMTAVAAYLQSLSGS
jgi:cytochrome c553